MQRGNFFKGLFLNPPRFFVWKNTKFFGRAMENWDLGSSFDVYMSFRRPREASLWSFEKSQDADLGVIWGKKGLLLRHFDTHVFQPLFYPQWCINVRARSFWSFTEMLPEVVGSSYTHQTTRQGPNFQLHIEKSSCLSKEKNEGIQKHSPKESLEKKLPPSKTLWCQTLE